MKKIIITESQLKRVIIERSIEAFPVGGNIYNVGYDEEGLGRKVKPKVLDKDKAVHNSDYSKRHGGIDIFALKGEPVVSPVDGMIVKIHKKPYGKGGKSITINDGQLNFYMAHLDSVLNLEKGDVVQAGDMLGTVGKTGNAKNTHPHVHFSVYGSGGYNKDNIDPWPFIENIISGNVVKKYSPMNNDDPNEKLDLFDIDMDGEILQRWGGNDKKNVKRLQSMLILLDYDIGNYGPNKDGRDGIYGPYTKNGVIEFQKDVFADNNEWDGMVGPNTYEKLIEMVDEIAEAEGVDREELIDSVGSEEYISTDNEDDDSELEMDREVDDTTFDDPTMGFPTGGPDSKKAMVGGVNEDWDGSMPRALAIARMAKDDFGASITSQKRKEEHTAGGNTSQHWVGSIKSYAVDLNVIDVSPGSPKDSEGDLLWDAIVDYLGEPGLLSGQWQNIIFEGYRYNLGWRVRGHYNHIHVGVKRDSTALTESNVFL